jgi:outer membrane protein assembly factor BamB
MSSAPEAAPSRPRVWEWLLAGSVPLLAAAMSYPWGFSLITAMLTGQPDRNAVRLLMIVMLALAAAGFVVAWPSRLKRFRNAVGCVALVGFGVASAAIVAIRVADNPARSVGLPLYVLGGMTAVWLPLLGLWTFTWWKRLVVLCGLGCVLASFWQVIRVDGLSGDALVVFGFRGTPDPESLPVSVNRAATDAASPLSPGPGDFAGYLGPQRDGRLPATRLASDWTASPPRERWRRRVGEGWGGFAIVGEVAITQEQRGDSETVVCYDLATGEERWIHSDPLRFVSGFGGTGPRATPTVVEDRILTLGATGRLNCLTSAGTCVWSVDTVPGAAPIQAVPAGDESTGEEPSDQGQLLAHGVAGSPLVVDSRVYVSPCGRDGKSLVAYDLATGSELFRQGTARASYASPMLVTLCGVPQILVFNEAGIASHDPEMGETLWSFPWGNDQKNNCGQPLVIDEAHVLLSTGYGTGSVALEINSSDDGNWVAHEKWRSRDLKSKFASPILHDGFVYGLDDGILVCVDVETGKRRWKAGRYGHGQLLLAGDLLLVQAEAGPVSLVRPSPEGLDELATLPALSGKTWNTLALAGNKLLVRNAAEAVCYELSLAEPPAALAAP